MDRHEEEFRKVLEALGPEGLKDQKNWGEPVTDPASFVEESLEEIEEEEE